MYVDFPEVKDSDRWAHAQPIDASRVRLTAGEAWLSLRTPGEPDAARLLMYDARPAYSFRLGNRRAVVFADTGEAVTKFTPDLNLRTAASWASRPARAARVEFMAAPDQWTVGGIYRQYPTLTKYGWPDGQQVYVASATGEVVQYTTRGSRILAYLGPVAHWLYFTPLRKNGLLWSRIVIWLSGAATVVALLGLYAGLSLYSRSRRIAFSGTKRLHMILGMFFGFLACTWAFSGMLSMDPFPMTAREDTSIPEALEGEPFALENFAAKPAAAALRGIAGTREIDFVSVPGYSWYVAVQDASDLRVIPVAGTFDALGFVRMAARANGIREIRMLNRYDAHYLDRTRGLPLPVVFVELNDPVRSRFYMDPRTARIVGSYSSDEWAERWLYHGLHSINLPWLYNHRPAWDIVVSILLLGGTALSVTSVIIGWSFLRRKVYSIAGDRSE